jgi:mannose-1-phosphate guanylyltransferase/mannose-6-phosphate isomerase
MNQTVPLSTATSSTGATRLLVQPVVLAGGSGSRLWPLSREHHPKQLLELLGEQSLLESTAQRLDGLLVNLPMAQELILVCGNEHRFISVDHLKRAGKPAQIVIEPVGRNTAPALTLAALSAMRDGRDSVMVIMPADHAIVDHKAFHASVASAVALAEEGAIVTMGIVPSRAETGYGYIKTGASLGDGGARKLERFVEKPHRELAQRYVDSGEYWWNSGIFVMRASVWLEAIAFFAPDIHAACASAFDLGKADGAFFRIDAEAFAACRSDSIDYAVMERLAGEPRFTAAAVPLDAGWSDIGSWDALWDLTAKDASGNVARGRVMMEQSSGSFVHSEGRLIACVGVEDMVVVETPDAILVAAKSHVQDVKAVVQRLKAEHGPEAENHRKVHRPWGYYDSVDNGDRFQVKRIVVHPGARLSLQMHYHRAEHWIVVRGTARVTRGEETFVLSENQSTYIPLGVTHRLENPGRTPLEIIEVQSGSYLGEDDIVRFDDTYGRS